LVTDIDPAALMVASPVIVIGANAEADCEIRSCPVVEGGEVVPVPPSVTATGEVRLSVVVAVRPVPTFRVARAPTGVPFSLVMVAV